MTTYTVIHHGLYGRIIEQYSGLSEADARSLQQMLNSNSDGNSWVQLLPEPSAHQRIIADAGRFLGPEIVGHR